MGWRLTTHALGYVIVVPILAAGYAVYGGVHALDDAMHYREVPARIAAIADLCAPDKNDPAYPGKVEWRACSTLDHTALRTKTPGRDLMHKVVVTMRYVSPADGRAHDGEIDMNPVEALRNHVDDDTALEGAQGPVMASIADPGKIHYDTWGFSQTLVSR